MRTSSPTARRTTGRTGAGWTHAVRARTLRARARPADLVRRAAVAILLVALPATSARALVGQPPCRGEIVIEPATMEVLYERNAHTPLATASMIKMLNALTALDAIESGEVSWDTPYTVSHDAALVGGSQVYLKEGEVFRLRELLQATLVESANDAAFAVGETVAGSEEAYVRRMRKKAAALGLEKTRIFSPNGLPSEVGRDHDDALTAWDLAVLGAELMKHPQLREWVHTKTAPFRNGTFQLYNGNHLLRTYPPAEGIKTGYHRFAHFGVTAAATKDGVRLIAVVMGCDGKRQCFGRAEELLERHFATYQQTTVVDRGARLLEPAPVRGGEAPTVPVVAGEEVRLMLRNDELPEVQTEVVSDRPAAPIQAGQPVGRLEVRRAGQVVAQIPVLAAQDLAAASFWARFWRHFLGG